ncbi:MAG: metallophosphoesterase family protein [Chloroflexi bacterium]|nr:metallophosphoesterase family protein [Chloroflexota bacterium]
MRLAVLADIHGNLPALQTVADHIERWRPEGVVLAGDVVNRGPRPVECWRFVQEKVKTQGWQLVRGNHEEYVVSQATNTHAPGSPEFEIARSSFWTYQKFNGEVSALNDLPFSLDLPSPGGGVRVAHASMRGSRDGIYPWTTDEELSQQVGSPPPALFVVGHTHRPLTRQVNGAQVVNVGSVGLPFDGDPRAGYAQFVWQAGSWQAEIVRPDYDRAQAERDFFDTGFYDEGGALAKLMVRELRIAQSQIGEWTVAWQAKVVAGEIGLEESVERFLAEGSNVTKTD